MCNNLLLSPPCLPENCPQGSHYTFTLPTFSSNNSHYFAFFFLELEFMEIKLLRFMNSILYKAATCCLFLNSSRVAYLPLVPILLRKSAIFRCPLCAQLFFCLCFPKVVIFDSHFSTMNDDLYGQVESKSSLWYKNQTIWLKNG